MEVSVYIYVCVCVCVCVYIYLYFNLFTWLCWVLAEACEIFGGGKQTLTSKAWDLVPWPGIEPGPLALGAQLATDHQGSPWWR